MESKIKIGVYAKAASALAGLGKVANAVKTIGAAYRGAQKDVNKFGKESILPSRAVKSLRVYARALKNARKQAEQLRAAANKKIMSGAKMVAAGAAIAAPFMIATQKAMKYSEGLAEIATLAPNKSVQQIEKEFGPALLKVSGKFGTAAASTTAAAYQAISAGIAPSSAAVTEFLEIAGKAAVGGVATMETAVDGITSVMNAYGKDIVGAGKASDLMFTAVRMGKTTFKELSNSLYNVTPTAAALGVKFEDVTASIAAMTAQGTPTSVATTQMNQLLAELAKGSTAVSKTFKKLSGKSFKQFVAAGGDVQGALKKLETYAGKSGKEMVDLFGSIEAGKAAMTLTGKGTQKFTDCMKEATKSTGDLDKAYGKMEQSAAFQFKQAQAQMGNLFIEIGSKLLPALVKLLGALKPIITAVSNWINEHSSLTAGILTVIGVISGFCVVLGALKMAFGAFIFMKSIVLGIKSFAIMCGIGKVAAFGFGGAINFAAAPIWLIVAAVAAAIAAISALVVYWDKIKGFFTGGETELKASTTTKHKVEGSAPKLPGLPKIPKVPDMPKTPAAMKPAAVPMQSTPVINIKIENDNRGANLADSATTAANEERIKQLVKQGIKEAFDEMRRTGKLAYGN